MALPITVSFNSTCLYNALALGWNGLVVTFITGLSGSFANFNPLVSGASAPLVSLTLTSVCGGAVPTGKNIGPAIAQAVADFILQYADQNPDILFNGQQISPEGDALVLAIQSAFGLY
jgi:hypothetical protein